LTKNEKKPGDAISLATQCDTRAGELRESLPTIAQLFVDAASMIRMQHQALSSAECKHVLTFNVTKEMVDSGRDAREPGKYCMTCGVLIPKPAKPKRDKKTEAAGDVEPQDNAGN
jgi:hypothetical protein